MYKRLLLSVLFLFGLCSLSEAQIISRGGLTLSGNYSNIISSASASDMDRNFLPGYGIGFFIESEISKTLSIQTNVEFSSRRYEYSTNFEPNQKATHNLFHVSVPVMAKFQSARFLPNFYGKLGPRVDFYLDSNDEMITTCSGWECGQIEDKEVMANSKTAAPGWSAALGRDVNAFGKRFSVEIRYNDDFGTINRDSSSEPIQKKSIDLWINIPISFK